MTKLSVNINKFATLRNARGGNNPDLLQVARDCEQFGGQGITVHPRPDERHIRRTDVLELKKYINTEFNIEGYPSEDFIALVCAVKPTQVTLVPDAPDQLTSNAGWNTKEKADSLTPIMLFVVGQTELNFTLSHTLQTIMPIAKKLLLPMWNVLFTVATSD